MPGFLNVTEIDSYQSNHFFSVISKCDKTEEDGQIAFKPKYYTSNVFIEQEKQITR